MSRPEITLPYNFTPRFYQLSALQALDSGYDRVILLLHRRAGKDKMSINAIAKKMFERVGTYFYVFPTYKQGRKVIWNGIDGDGFRFIDHIPKELRKRKNDQEMMIETVNGSIFQVVGSDSLDGVIGTNPVGCVFSEYALQSPDAWAFLKPILDENGGWAMFVYTPRGRQNHGYHLWKLAENDPDNWWKLKMSVEETKVIAPHKLEQIRKEYIELYGDETLFLQEYYCDFNVNVAGTYYFKNMEQARKEERITALPHISELPVHTAWDIGVGDSTAIWFFQVQNNRVHLIDYYEAQGEGLHHYIVRLQSKPYTYGDHFAPHDIVARDFSTGVSRQETAKRLGIKFIPLPKLSIDDGIHAVRSILSRCYFDKNKCKRGITALENYRKEWNNKMNEYKNRPVHDEFSHAADAFRYLAIGVSKNLKKQKKKKRKVYIPPPLYKK